MNSNQSGCENTNSQKHLSFEAFNMVVDAAADTLREKDIGEYELEVDWIDVLKIEMPFTIEEARKYIPSEFLTSSDQAFTSQHLVSDPSFDLYHAATITTRNAFINLCFRRAVEKI